MESKVKPILNTDQQIAHLQAKGVKFNILTVEDAKEYLRKNNNYFKLRAYRKNFPKHPGGACAGQYINLDFAMLKDLAIIDMRLRYTLIHLALDIEHFSKVRLLKAVEDAGEDGYQIVTDYMNSLSSDSTDEKNHRHNNLNGELLRNVNNPYCGGIIAKYNGCYPVWAFVEIIPLGTFIHFYGFCAERFNRKDLKDDFFLLNAIKKIRNAAAHSNCIIHDMGAKDAKHTTNYNVLRALSSISRSTRDIRLKNERMQQIVSLLYAHTVIVTSSGVHEHEKKALNDLVERMHRNIAYYQGNDVIVKNFEFLKKTIDILFP